MQPFIQNLSKIPTFGTFFFVVSLTGCAIGLNITVIDTSVEEDKGPISIDPNDGQTGGQTSGGQTSGGQTSGGQTGYDTGIVDPTDTGPMPAGLLESISPRFGSTSGNTLITITGGPFDAGTQVYLGPMQATVVTQTTSTLQVLSPMAQNEGSVDITVNTLIDSASYPLGFAYFADAVGDTGAIGVLRYYTLMGSYWEAGATLDQGEVEIVFVNSPNLHVWELSVPALDTCSPSSYTYSGSYLIYDFQEPQMYLQSSAGSQVTLFWDTQQSMYRSSTLSHSALPDNTFFDLMPFTGPLEGFEVTPFAKTSQTVNITNPVLQGTSAPSISQYQQFNWIPSGASWIGITMAINNNPINGTYADMIHCMVIDDGNFSIQGNFYTQWIAGRQVDVYFSRYVEHEVVLPHNNSIGRIVGEYVQFGAGIAQ